LLDRVVTEHASNVCSRGRVAHALDPGRDPKQRLRQAGVAARRVGEAVARDLAPSRAFARMLESPSHRATLLEPGFTDVGLGRATDLQGRSCLVVLLAAWPRYLGH
jgi:uncharacterized protein YkwD